jgi:general secretion pathway protein C
MVRGYWSWVAGKGPKLASLALLGLGAGEAVHLSYAFWRGSHAVTGAAGAPATPVARFVPGTQSIVGAHLFGTAPQARGNEVETAPPSSLVLDGTLAFKDPRHGMAIISNDGHSGFYVVGEHIGNAALHLVYADHVILERDGTLVTLQWRHAAAAGLLKTQSPGGRFVRAAYYTDNLGRVVDSPPSELEKIIRTVQMVDESTGKLQGLRVYPVANGTPMRILGLYPGDLVTAINGTALADLKRSPNILEAIQSLPQATVTVERQNQKLDLVLNIADATRSLASESDPAPDE